MGGGSKKVLWIQENSKNLFASKKLYQKISKE